MLLAETARREGQFDWLAPLATKRAAGSPQRLFLLIYGVGTIVSVFRSNACAAKAVVHEFDLSGCVPTPDVLPTPKHALAVRRVSDGQIESWGIPAESECDLRSRSPTRSSLRRGAGNQATGRCDPAHNPTRSMATLRPRAPDRDGAGAYGVGAAQAPPESIRHRAPEAYPSPVRAEKSRSLRFRAAPSS